MIPTITEGIFSSEKDHTNMTGGTLSVDKKISGMQGMHTYNVRLFTGVDTLGQDESFHKALHSIEHLLAYTRDTGSIRAQYEEKTMSLVTGKNIIDISPYKNSDGMFGFRLTSVLALEVDMLQEAIKNSVQIALSYLQKHDNIPFATELQCGQYDFHDRLRAIELLRSVRVPEVIHRDMSSENHTHAFVCDLRLLKPKLSDHDNMIMFDPDLSYALSAEIESRLPDMIGGAAVVVGTYGCMTGMYLTLSSPDGDESALPSIHVNIMHIIRSYREQCSDANYKKQLDAVIANYELPIDQKVAA